MDPQVRRDVAAALETTKSGPLSVPAREDRATLLSSLVDMALGSKNARTEAEALQMNFLADK
jgi:hypothetical protein